MTCPQRFLSPERLAGAAGMLGVALPVAGLAVLPIWEFPVTTSSAAALADFFARNKGPFEAVMVLNALGVSLWQVFGAGVWLRLRRASAEADYWSAAFALSFLSFTTLLLAGFVSVFLLSYAAFSPAVQRALYDVGFGLLAMSGIPTAIAMAAFLLHARRKEIFPPASTWLAVLAGVAHLGLLASFIVPSGFFSLEGQVITVVPGLLFAWIFTTGLFMFRFALPDGAHAERETTSRR